ncbi:hypothetical protein PR001_g25141 [Phytophthora rubi]|uniref:Uncharacterized protein n=1 Tax=Phytophthora rubi TaxID=129364 RepID=A0A6A3I5H1_9STRA|nr:hypothetical protein PR001_g25141 [Phytophthora rubi]
MRRTSSSARISSGHEECRNSPVILGVCVHEVVGISANVQAEMAEKNVQAEMAENEVQADMAENEPNGHSDVGFDRAVMNNGVPLWLKRTYTAKNSRLGLAIGPAVHGIRR